MGRAEGTNPRARGANPRARGTNPRAQGTAPKTVTRSEHDALSARLDTTLEAMTAMRRDLHRLARALGIDLATETPSARRDWAPGTGSLVRSELSEEARAALDALEVRDANDALASAIRTGCSGTLSATPTERDTL